MDKPKLPLRIRAAIRDQFDAPASSVTKATESLESVLGLKVSCNVEWEMLWAELQNSFSDKATFVPIIAGVVSRWYSVLEARIDDKKFASWTEDLLIKLESEGVLKLHLQVSEESQPTTHWASTSSSFFLSFPRTNLFSPNSCSAGFEADFQSQSFFESKSKRSQAEELASKDDDWSAVDEKGDSHSIRLKETVMEPDFLPAVETLPSPEILLRTLVPLILHVRLQGSTKIVLNGTHQPSLQLISEYLQRWTKLDHQDSRKIPILRISLSQSHFGVGITYDTLNIEPYNQNFHHVEVNPTLVLAFVEGVLGYHQVGPGSQGQCYWEFRRNTSFK